MITTLLTPSDSFMLQLTCSRLRDSSLFNTANKVQLSNAEFMRCNVYFERECQQLGRPNRQLACSACFTLRPVREFPDAFVNISHPTQDQGRSCKKFCRLHQLPKKPLDYFGCWGCQQLVETRYERCEEDDGNVRYRDSQGADQIMQTWSKRWCKRCFSTIDVIASSYCQPHVPHNRGCYGCGDIRKPLETTGVDVPWAVCLMCKRCKNTALRWHRNVFMCKYLVCMIGLKPS